MTILSIMMGVRIMDIKSDFIKFSEIITGFACMIRVTIGKEYVKEMYKLFDSWGFTIEQIQIAAGNLLKTHVYSAMPTPAEFFNAVNGKAITAEDKGLIEAHRLLNHLHTFGSGKNPEINDLITKKIMTGEWEYNKWGSTLKQEKEVWWVKEFVKLYNAHNNVIQAELLEDQRDVKRLIGNIFEKI